MSKLPRHLGFAAIILGLGLNTLLASAQTATFSPTYTYYDPAYSTASDPNATSTTSDPSTTTTTDSGTNNTTTSSTTPEPGTYDPAVLQGPSSGGQPVGTTDTSGTSTTDPNQPTGTTEPAPTTNSTTPSTTSVTRPPSRYTPPTPSGTNPAPEPAPKPVTQDCPPIDPLANQPVECPKTEVIPVIPQPPYFLGLTAILGVILFWVIFTLLNRQQSHSEARLSANQLAHSHQQTVSSTRERAYTQLLDFLTATISTDKPFNQTEYQHLSSQIELLGTPAMQNLNLKIKDALDSGKTSDLKPLARELADQIKLESQV